jgi:hypothetical protein
MKFAFRTPSLRRMISARTSPRRFIAPSIGVKARAGSAGSRIQTARSRTASTRTTFGIGDVIRWMFGRGK